MGSAPLTFLIIKLNFRINKKEIMKKQILYHLKGAALIVGFTSLSFAGFSQAHMTLSLENITVTSNSIEYDLVVTNDGTTDIKLGGCAYGVNFNNQILNGANLEGVTNTFISGTQSQTLAGLRPYGLKLSQAENLSQLRLAMASCTKENASSLLQNVPYRIGRFKFTNSMAWRSNSNPAFSLNESGIVGFTTTLGIGYVDNSAIKTSFSVGAKNLTCKVVASPVLNPSKGSTSDFGIATDAVAMVNTYPNPAQDILNVDFNASSMASTVVKISDISGRIVKTIQMQSVIGYNNINISLQGIVNGLYTVQVYLNEKLIFVEKMNKKE